MEYKYSNSIQGGVNYLDLIRIIATIMVLIVHLAQHVLPINHPVLEITRYGDRGVPIFFALSGYLIMHSILKTQTLKVYYLKRIFRIIPLYYAILTILVVFYPMPKDELGLGWLRYYLFMNEIIPAHQQEWNSICGFWCIPSFIIFYLISPLIFKYTNSFGKFGLVVLAFYIIGKVLTHTLQPYYEINSVRSFINTMPIFFYGCWAFSAVKNNKIPQFLTLSACLLITFSTLNLSNYQIWGTATSVIIITTTNMPISTIIKNSLILKWFSKLSFTIFLVHYMILFLLDKYNLAATIYIPLFIITTGLSAYILYYMIERPTNKILKNILSTIHN